VGFHDLRHTFATRLAATGTPSPTIQEFLGHADSKTTQIYAPRPFPRALRDISQLWPHISDARQKRVLEFLRDQVELTRLEASRALKPGRSGSPPRFGLRFGLSGATETPYRASTKPSCSALSATEPHYTGAEGAMSVFRHVS
jgi:hypothetical protein